MTETENTGRSSYQARFWADRHQFHATIKVNEVPRG